MPENKNATMLKCNKCKNSFTIDEDDYELFLEYYDESDVFCEKCSPKNHISLIIEQIKDDEKVNDDMDTEDIKDED